MARANYEIIRYTPRLRREVAELHVHHWGADIKLNERYLEWKHEQNPYLYEPLVYLAVHDGCVVGMRGAFGARWEVGAQEVSIPCAGDLVIAPEHRNRGLFTRIMNMAFDDLADRGFDWVFNFVPKKVTYMGSLTMGWRSIGSVQPMIRTPPRRRLVTRVRRRVRRMLGREQKPEKPLDPFAVFDRRAGAQPRSHTCASSVARPADMARLIERLGRDGRIRHIRDAAYLAWRYRNPMMRYRFIYCEADNLSGYLVLAARPRTHTVRIVDWEATAPGIREDLLSAAIAWGRFRRLRVWSASQPPDTLSLLARHGFESVEHTPGFAGSRHPVLVRPTRLGALEGEWLAGGRPLLDPASWDLRMIYWDGV